MFDRNLITLALCAHVAACTACLDDDNELALVRAEAADYFRRAGDEDRARIMDESAAETRAEMAGLAQAA